MLPCVSSFPCRAHMITIPRIVTGAGKPGSSWRFWEWLADFRFNSFLSPGKVNQLTQPVCNLFWSVITATDCIFQVPELKTAPPSAALQSRFIHCKPPAPPEV